jgi:hypothetical protein
MGLTLRAKEGGRLGYKPERLCPAEFRQQLAEYKPLLLPLLSTKGKTWTEVYSQHLGEIIYLCADEHTKASLVEAGASELSIYTRDELRTLAAQNRIAPLSGEELRKLHELKHTFNARLHD